jgi:uncharacterized SAM-binding protein YcdF (DUF218 family)
VLAWAIDNTVLADRLVTPLQRPDTQGNADAIVVLGGGAYEPCGCNLSSIRRTDLAVRLFRGGRAPRLLFTGGSNSDTGGVAVAHYMANLARAQGVPPDAILEEDRSRTTAENAIFASRLLRSRNARSILLVTDSLHMRRADESFSNLGFTIERASVPQACVSASNVDMLLYALHEYAGWCVYRLRGRPEPG